MQRLRIETDTHLAAEVRSSEDAAVDASEARQAALNSRREKLKQVLDTEAAEAMQGFKERGLALMK